MDPSSVQVRHFLTLKVFADDCSNATLIDGNCRVLCSRAAFTNKTEIVELDAAQIGKSCQHLGRLKLHCVHL